MAGRKNRVLATAAAALALTLGIAACGSDDDDGGGGGGGDGDAKIALLLPETKTTRYEEQDRPNFERKVKELCADCEVIYSNANQDPAKQQQQAEAAITQGAKVIVISSVDVKSAAAIVERAAQSDVAVIAYGRLIPDAPIDYYVSIDPFEVGKQQAEVQMDAIEKAGGADPKVVMINGAPTDSNAKPYKDGAPSDVSRSAAHRSSRASTRPTGALTRPSRRWRARSPIWATTASTPSTWPTTAWPAAPSPRSRASSIDPATRYVTGQDAELAGIQRILIGEQLMTVYQPIIQIAETAAEIAVPIAQGKETRR